MTWLCLRVRNGGRAVAELLCCDFELLGVVVEAGRAAELLLPLADLAELPEVASWLQQCVERGRAAAVPEGLAQ